MTAALVQAMDRVNEYFGVGVKSKAMAGVAPKLSPGWARRRKNIYTEVRYALSLRIKGIR